MTKNWYFIAIISFQGCIVSNFFVQMSFPLLLVSLQYAYDLDTLIFCRFV
jgi:hypothetical protein